VILEKKNQAVPGEPVIVPAECLKELLYSFGQYPLRVKKVSSDKWECDLKRGQEYVIGWKVKAGWFSKKFHGYFSEPFIAERDGQIVNFEPGMPVTFKYDLSNAPEFLDIKKYPVKVKLDRAGPDGEKLQFSFYGEGTVEINKPGIGQIPNLAAGAYYLTAFSSPGNYAIPHIADRRQITIKPGNECRIEPLYPVLDKTIEPGDVSIKGVVFDAGQNPIADEQVFLWMQRYDEKGALINSDIFYEPVVTDSKGIFEFKGIEPGRNISIKCLKEEKVFSKGSFPENAKVDVSFVIGQKAEPATVGKPFIYPNVRLGNDKKKCLDEFKGKIIVVDIWASWCPPCIGSMPKLNELAKQMRSENIQFVTLSVDEDQRAWKNMLAENNWQFLLHTWFDNAINNHKPGHKGSIPFYVIIDQQGVVISAGNRINIKREIGKLLKKKYVLEN
jgi:thiol-disulfide isomerase/thioredoxin